MQRSTRFLISFGLIAAMLSPHCAQSADWPMWRNDAAHGAATSETLARELHLQWSIQLPAPRPAWPLDQTKVQFDASYEAIVAGQSLIVPSMVRDSVTAYDTRRGHRRWQFFADGPVRFAPLAHREKIYFVSDDGYLYCLRASDGALVWKFRGGPSDRKVLGNDRLISMWPARGAPVLYDGVVYFSAGIWPFMGIFIHAVDAETGAVVWTNSGSGSNYLVQPHNSPAFAGVAPQGYLAANENVLLVPGGRSVPAAYDRRTGEFLYFRIGQFGKKGGGYSVITGHNWFFQPGILCSDRDGQLLDGGLPGGEVVTASNEQILQRAGNTLTALDGRPTFKDVQSLDRKGTVVTRRQIQFKKVWQTKLPPQMKKIFLKAGNRLYGGDGGKSILAIDLPEGDGQTADISWSGKIRGAAWNMIAADQRLFVVSREGAIFCFGADQRRPSAPDPLIERTVDVVTKPSAESNTLAGQLLKQTGRDDGYCLVLGLSDVALVEQLALQSQFHVIALESDSRRVAAARARWNAAGLLGRRIAVVETDPATAKLPQYMANLIVCPDFRTAGFGEDDGDAGRKFIENVFDVLRPYGGTAVLLGSDELNTVLKNVLEEREPGGAALECTGDTTFIRRDGPLPGSATWTHNNADIGNTLISLDDRVKTPLGLLWFGGPSNQQVLPRHGHGPTPQVVGGRLFIEGPDMLRAVDVYTGRLLWQRTLKDLGSYYDNTGHHPGAGAIGGNYVSLADGIYVAYGRECLWLDPATGKTISTFNLPEDATGQRPIWGYVGVYDDVLIAGSSPMLPFSRSRSDEKPDTLYAQYGEGSSRIVALNRHTGQVLWKRDAEFNFRHNAIAAGDGRLFCLDRMTEARLSLLKRRGQVPDAPPVLYALDVRTGEVVWQHVENVFGTWLAYSAKHRLLLQAGSSNRDRAKDEASKGMTVYRADTGAVVWQSDVKYAGPPLIHEDTIITQGSALSLLTGQKVTRKHPLTGTVSPWSFSRNYGCNTAIGCTNLLTFRSAAAGYFDLAGDGGTGNIGGFRSSCTSNLVPADGVLNAPDYTRTCSCSYQHQCSLALVYMRDVEMWTFNAQSWDGRRVRRVGINFGAPGDRRDANGTLWLDYPSVGGKSPDLPVEIAGTNVHYFRNHASSVGGVGPAWVGGSGVRGADTIRITLAEEGGTNARKYTVRLHFADDGHNSPSSPTFDIALQGKIVDRDFDVARSAGGANRSVVRQFQHVEVTNQLEIALSSPEGQTVLSGVEAILED